jgi:serine/threonine-protein kinase
MDANWVDCFDENAIEAWLQRTLTASGREAYEVHLDGCESCRQLMASCARDSLIESLAGGGVFIEDVLEEETVDAATQIRMPPVPDEVVDSRPTVLADGTLIAHFCTMSLLGRGGMADVYLARDTQLGRKVALKWFDAKRFRSAKDKRRFLREVRTTAKFNHPNIVTLYAAGEQAEGTHAGGAYVAIEYIRGTDLRARLAKGPLALREALAISGGIANALVEAHRHRVLHCDLKPGNVMLGRHGEVRVIDFGLAGRSAPPVSARSYSNVFGAPISDRAPTTLTRGDGDSSKPTRSQGGSPRYMAPEQWWDDPCSGKTDVWAAGLILYEMLSGEPAFDADDMVPLAAQVTGDDAAPRLTIGPPAVIALVAKCLHKDPRRRPSAVRLVELLQAV